MAMLRIMIACVVCMAVARAAWAVADEPAADRSVPIGDGRFQFTPPAADQWEAVDQENPNVIVYRTKKKDALVAVQMLPGEMEINADVTAALLKQLRETHQQKREKMILEPTVESDDDLALRVHERYMQHRKIADRVHMYRLVGKRMALAVVNSKGQSEDETKAVQAAAKEALLSVTGPVKNAKRAATGPATRPK
jgi:hypothetical protein